MTSTEGFATTTTPSGSGGEASAHAREFGATFAAEEPRLFAIALSILRRPSDAEDAVQVTAFRAWKSWERRTDLDKTDRWLAKICVRHCLTARRSLLQRLAMNSELKEWVPFATSDASVDGFDFALDHAYARLSVRQRAVVSLHYYQGYTLNECADLMHCSSGAVASHLSRALTKLRKELSYD